VRPFIFHFPEASMTLTDFLASSGIDAHSTPDPDVPPATEPPQPAPEPPTVPVPDDVPAPTHAPVTEPGMPGEPIRTAA
jgi:hypothetical protein